MSATVGPEDLLTQELLAVLQGKAPATEQWKKGYSAARTLDPDYSGSCNIPLLGAAIRLRLLGDARAALRGDIQHPRGVIGGRRHPGQQRQNGQPPPAQAGDGGDVDDGSGQD